jgi:hypothetical protein
LLPFGLSIPLNTSWFVRGPEPLLKGYPGSRFFPWIAQGTVQEKWPSRPLRVGFIDEWALSHRRLENGLAVDK